MCQGVVELTDTLMGTNDWITIDEIPIKNASDFRFSRKDYLVAAKEYEWALVPFNGVAEGNYTVNSLVVQFEGLFIVTRDRIYNTVLDVNVKSSTKNSTTTIKPLGSKHPYKIKNSKSQYRSGTVSATFIETDALTKEWKIKEAYQHREDLTEFLCDETAKILKLEDGRAWIIVVVGDIAEVQAGYTDHFINSFEWDEIGSVNDKYALAENGFIDIGLVTK